MSTAEKFSRTVICCVCGSEQTFTAPDDVIDSSKCYAGYMCRTGYKKMRQVEDGYMPPEGMKFVAELVRVLARNTGFIKEG